MLNCCLAGGSGAVENGVPTARGTEQADAVERSGKQCMVQPEAETSASNEDLIESLEKVLEADHCCPLTLVREILLERITCVTSCSWPDTPSLCVLLFCLLDLLVSLLLSL